MKKYLPHAITVLLILLVAFVLYTEALRPGVCILNPNQVNTPCDVVQNSPYGTIFGLRVGTFGVIALAALLIFYILANTDIKARKFWNRVFVYTTLLGAIFALYFLFVQAVLLKTFCSTCVVTDIGIILLSIITYQNYRITSRKH